MLHNIGGDTLLKAASSKGLPPLKVVKQLKVLLVNIETPCGDELQKKKGTL